MLPLGLIISPHLFHWISGPTLLSYYHIGPRFSFGPKNPSAPDILDLLFDPWTKGETIPPRQGLPHEHARDNEGSSSCD